MWIKICGTTNLEDAQLAVEAGANAVGFVFAESSRRVTAEQVGEITARLPVGVEKIGVFMDEGFDEVARAVLTAELTGVQIHGGVELGPELALRLRERFAEGLPGAGRLRVLQVLHFGFGDISFDEQLTALRQNDAIDAVLVDSRTATARGGTGVSYDWQAARQGFVEAAPHLRMVVAGGLSPENVRQAIETLDPWGVDVVSGVEAAPGRKDAAKVRAFVENAREAALKLGRSAGD